MDSDGKAKSQRRKAQRVGGDQCFARPPSEHVIWQSQMSLKGASGAIGTRSARSPTCV
ncbi:MAG: hypothetical protein V4492_08730 [Chlamydiota bacterium]